MHLSSLISRISNEVCIWWNTGLHFTEHFNTFGNNRLVCKSLKDKFLHACPNMRDQNLLPGTWSEYTCMHHGSCKCGVGIPDFNPRFYTLSVVWHLGNSHSVQMLNSNQFRPTSYILLEQLHKYAAHCLLQECPSDNIKLAIRRQHWRQHKWCFTILVDNWILLKLNVTAKPSLMADHLSSSNSNGHYNETCWLKSIDREKSIVIVIFENIRLEGCTFLVCRPT